MHLVYRVYTNIDRDATDYTAQYRADAIADALQRARANGQGAWLEALDVVSLRCVARTFSTVHFDGRVALLNPSFDAQVRS
jgi:hypothetical protein